MPVLGALPVILFSLLFSWSAWAGFSCTQTEAVVRQCMDDRTISRISPFPAATGPSPYGDSSWMRSANLYAAMMRESETKFLTCVRQFEVLQIACPGAGSGYNISWKSSVLQRAAVQADVMNKLNYMIATANSRYGTERYALTCFNHSTYGYNFPLCFVLDRQRTSYMYRSVTDAEDLPLRVGASEDCSFYVDDSNRVFTADHCGLHHLEHGWPLGLGFEGFSSSFRMSLPHVAKEYNGGQPFEDLAMFTVMSPLKPMGKAVYHLALDETLSSDCELRSGVILACSEMALVSLGDKVAETLSFPAAIYLGANGERRRERPLSVLHARGPLVYEPRLERLYFHAYSRPGSSGAPVFLPAGGELGGVPLDHPLVLGVISASVGSRVSSAHALPDDVLSVISVPRYRRLVQLLNESRAVFATGTVR